VAHRVEADFAEFVLHDFVHERDDALVLELGGGADANGGGIGLAGFVFEKPRELVHAHRLRTPKILSARVDRDGLKPLIGRRGLLGALRLAGQVYGNRLLLLDERGGDHEDDQEHESHVHQVGDVELSNGLLVLAAAKGAGHESQFLLLAQRGRRPIFCRCVGVRFFTFQVLGAATASFGLLAFQLDSVGERAGEVFEFGDESLGMCEDVVVTKERGDGDKEPRDGRHQGRGNAGREGLDGGGLLSRNRAKRLHHAPDRAEESEKGCSGDD